MKRKGEIEVYVRKDDHVQCWTSVLFPSGFLRRVCFLSSFFFVFIFLPVSWFVPSPALHEPGSWSHTHVPQARIHTQRERCLVQNSQKTGYTDNDIRGYFVYLFLCIY